MTRFALSQLQADAILQMQLRALTGLEREKLENDYKELLKQIAFYEDILASPARVVQIIKQEMKALRDKYGDERRSRIIPMEAEEIGDEDLIPEEEMIISITRDGYIKRVPKETYPTQHRGGKGRIGAATKEEDAIEHLFVATTHHFILFFTDRGRVYRLKAYEVPQTSRTAMGSGGHQSDQHSARRTNHGHRADEAVQRRRRLSADGDRVRRSQANAAGRVCQSAQQWPDCL